MVLQNNAIINRKIDQVIVASGISWFGALQFGYTFSCVHVTQALQKERWKFV